MLRAARLSSLSLGCLLLPGLLACSSDAEPGPDELQDGEEQTVDDATDDGGADDTTPDESSKRDSASDSASAPKDGGSGSSQDASKPAVAADGGGSAQADAAPSGPLEPFSFFVTSLRAMQELSGSPDGFGGDLRFGETGEGAGLRGADKICSTIAESSMPGAGSKVWRAFLSTVAGGENGGPVHAADRIGEGPWYDRVGRLVGMGKTDLLQLRPAMADATIKNDLPNEDGVANHDPDGSGPVDNHDILTGTGSTGQLYKNDPRSTCNDWTKSEADRNDAPRVGHSWPRGGFGGGFGGGGGPRPGGGGTGGTGGMSMASIDNWMSSLDEAGCGPGVFLIEMGPPMESNPTVGSGGGYGGIYCFALTP